MSDEIIGDIIIRKLTSSSVVVSFAEIARVAREKNRVRLAAQVRPSSSRSFSHSLTHVSLQLLDHEVHARDQVPLLMEMKKADLALDKAIESGDPQLGKPIMHDHVPT